MLANEQVLATARCERCGAEVESRLMEQWFFRITDYAQALLDDLETVDWPESIKARQRNWIGRSEGAEILFRIEELDEDVPVFTTRPDTLYGATFFVLAPEHELVARIDSDEVREYVRRAAAKKTEERAAATEKTGVFTGLHAVNPVNGERLPVYVADYVLTDYGTGAIMAVPAHDQRDFDFASAFGLADPPGRAAARRGGGRERRLRRARRRARCSSTPASSTGCPAPEGGRRIVEKLAAEGRGRFTINYRLRDWGFSRQRYWGCPIPIVYCDDVRDRPGAGRRAAGRAPRDRGLQAEGRAAARAGRGLGERPVPALRRAGAKRETETMDTFVDSSWYFLRYCDPRNDTAPFDRAAVDYWNPVDLYIGGVDHATVHMIYARFWVKVLNDLGHARLPRAVRAVLLERLGHAREDEDVEAGRQRRRAGRLPRALRRGRLPAEHPVPRSRRTRTWSGPRRASRRWRASSGGSGGSSPRWPTSAPAGEPDGRRRSRGRRTDDREGHRRHRPPLRVQHGDRGGDGARQRALTRVEPAPDSRFAAETAVSLIQPYAPHVAEELWERLGHERLWEAPWPVADPAMLEVDTVEVVVQVNGKIRDRLQVSPDMARTSSSRWRARPSGCGRTSTAASSRGRSSCRASSSTS